jgi:hypothetical protein
MVGAFAWRKSGLDVKIILLGSALTALALSCPLITMQQYGRLVIMSSIPAAWALLAAVTAARSAWTPMILGPLAAIVAIRSQGNSGGQGPKVAMSELKLAQIRSLKSKLPKSGSTVIVARHGLEFWVTYALRVRTSKSESPELYKSFQHVLRLQEVDGEPSMNPGNRFPGGNQAGTLIGSTTSFRLFRLRRP